jgi:hypothetical protein
MTRKPGAIRVAELSKAVQVAVGKRKILPEPGIHIGPILMGIIFREPVLQLDEAGQIAARITEEVETTRQGASGLTKLEPGIFGRPGGPILCGFIPENLTILE